jgi:hypothetical protein
MRRDSVDSYASEPPIMDLSQGGFRTPKKAAESHSLCFSPSTQQALAHSARAPSVESRSVTSSPNMFAHIPVALPHALAEEEFRRAESRAEFDFHTDAMTQRAASVSIDTPLPLCKIM